MKLLRNTVVLLFCAILLTVTFSASAEPGGDVVCVTIQVNLHYNKIGTHHGITVYLDDIEVAHLDQGDQMTFGACMMRNETHVLSFSHDKERIRDLRWTFSNLQDGTVIFCNAKATFGKVKLISSSISVDNSMIVKVDPESDRYVRNFGTFVSSVAKGLAGK